MFTISLAGVPVGIDNRYPYVRWLCRNYIAEDQTPAFTVRAADQELAAELAEAGEMSPAYAESLCLYRSICMKMPLYGAFLMHAAVVEVDGIAYVFTAPSGTGKSTHVQLWLDRGPGCSTATSRCSALKKTPCTPAAPPGRARRIWAAMRYGRCRGSAFWNRPLKIPSANCRLARQAA